MAGISKIVADGVTLVDITGDTVTSGDLKSGATALDKAGNALTGTSSSSSTAAPEYKKFSIYDDGRVYAVKTGDCITVNITAKCAETKQSSTTIGSLPKNWGASEAAGKDFSTTNDGIYVEDNRLKYEGIPTLSVQSLEITATSALLMAGGLSASSTSFPALTKSAKWSASADDSLGLFTSDSYINFFVYDNIVMLDGLLTFSADHFSDSWLTCLNIPDGYRPPMDIGIPYYKNNNAVDCGYASIDATGDLQLKTEAQQKVLFTYTGGTKAGMPIGLHAFYPIKLGTEVT